MNIECISFGVGCMKVVDAFWEKRNLAVDCYEISIEHDDDVNEIATTIKNLDGKKYIVFKIPVTRPDVVSLVQDFHFRFIETALVLVNQISLFEVPGRYKSIVSRCSYERMNDDDMKELWDELKKNLFHTDRIYLDSHFNHEMAAQRYIFWIKDVLEMGEVLYKVLYNNKIIGFFINKCDGHDCHSGILSGVYKKYQGTGLGFVVELMCLQALKDVGCKKLVTRISGNNPEIMNVSSVLGYKIKKMEYVFVKHIG